MPLKSTKATNLIGTGLVAPGVVVRVGVDGLPAASLRLAAGLVDAGKGTVDLVLFQSNEILKTR